MHSDVSQVMLFSILICCIVSNLYFRQKIIIGNLKHLSCGILCIFIYKFRMFLTEGLSMHYWIMSKLQVQEVTVCVRYCCECQCTVGSRLALQCGAYTAPGKACLEQVTTSTVCLVSAELKDLKENLCLHCEISREKQCGHINAIVWWQIHTFGYT